MKTTIWLVVRLGIVLSLLANASATIAGVDYAITSISVNRNNAAPGDQMIATVDVKNVGTVAAAKVSVVAMRLVSQSARPIPVTGQLGTFNVSPLAPGQTTEVQFAFYVPSVSDGTYFVWAIADNTSVLGQASTAIDNDFGRSSGISVAKAAASGAASTTNNNNVTTGISSSNIGSSPPASTPSTPTTTTPAPSTPPPASNSSGSATQSGSSSPMTLTSGNSRWCWTTNVYDYANIGSPSGTVDGRIRPGGWGDTYAGFIQFDLAGIAGPVVSARLRLYVLKDENKTTAVNVGRITTPWVPTTAVAWSHKPDSATFTTLPAPAWQSWVELDVTDLVNAWLRGEPNYGLSFSPVENDDAYTTFASPGNSDATLHPQLVIVTSAPTPSQPATPPATPTGYDPSFPQPDFTLPFYTTANVFWTHGFAPASTNPPTPQLGASLGNCTWYALGRELQLGYDANELAPLTGNAATWATVARASGLRVDTSPQVGAIAQSDTEDHVAIVERVNSDGTIEVSESAYTPNLTSAWNFLYRTRTVSAGWFSAFIHVDPARSTATSPSVPAAPAPSSPTTTTAAPTPTSGANAPATPPATSTAPSTTNASPSGSTTSGSNANSGNAGNTSTAVVNTGLATQVTSAPSSKLTSMSTLSSTPAIAGFCITGNAPKTLVIRAVGPTLSILGVTGLAEDPHLRIYDNGGHQIAENDDWGGGTDVRAAFLSVGVFALPDNSKDAAIVITLQPGIYTAQVSSNGANGFALLEVYEVK